MILQPTDICTLKVLYTDAKSRFTFLSLSVNGVRVDTLRFTCEQDPASFLSTFTKGVTFTVSVLLNSNQVFTCVPIADSPDMNAYEIVIRHGGTFQYRNEDTSSIYDFDFNRIAT